MYTNFYLSIFMGGGGGEWYGRWEFIIIVFLWVYYTVWMFTRLLVHMKKKFTKRFQIHETCKQILH